MNQVIFIVKQFTSQMKVLVWFSLLAIACMVDSSCQEKNTQRDPAGASILIFTKTEAFRHECIEPGVKALESYFAKYHINMAHSEDSLMFTTEKLQPFDAVVF